MFRFSLIVFLLIPLSILSQNRDDYFKVQVVSNSDTPDWAQLMYSEDPNVYEVDRLFETYYQQNEYSKTLHGQNYKFWRKCIEAFIDDHGFIRPPSKDEEDNYFKRLKKKNSDKASNKNSDNWTSLGPIETYKDGTLTPYSNQVNVYSIDQSPSNTNILVCGTESSGVFRTEDKGLNWSLISANEVFVGGISAVKIHPTDPNTILITGNNRIYKTVDAGNSWSEVHYINSTANEIKYHPDDHTILFCTTSNGLYKSVNGGTSWSTIYTEYCWDIDFHPTNTDTVYLLKKNGVKAEFFLSDDGGLSWTLKDNGWYIPDNESEANAAGGKIAVTPADPNRVYACLIGDAKDGDNGWIGVYRSDDRGTNWTNLVGQNGGPYNSPSDTPWNVAAYTSGYHQGFYNFDCEASHNDPDVIWIGTVRLSESADGSLTFEAIGAANSNRLSDVHADIQDIEVLGNDIWVASDGGINYSNDELMSHESRKKGITGSNFWGFGSGWNEDALVGGRYHNGNHGYYQTYGNGNGHKLGGVEESTGYVNPFDSRKTYFSEGWTGSTASRRMSSVLGGNFTTLADVNILPNEHYIESYSSGLYFDYRYASHIYSGSGSKFWKSVDGGGSFEERYDFGTDSRVLEIVQSRANYDVFYLVLKPNGTNSRELYRTEDGGLTWTNLPDVPTNNRNKLEISLNSLDENEIWVCANDASNGNKVYNSTDGGNTWNNKTTSTLDGEHPIDIFYQDGTDDVVYLMTNNSIFYWYQATGSWNDYGNGLPLIINGLQMRPFYRDNKIRFAGSRGIYESEMLVSSSPITQPMTESDSIFCARDTVQFDCYSVVNHQGASWEWTFSPEPTYISSTNERNPKVVFGYAASFDISLEVTDGNGNSDSKTIENMVSVLDGCSPDTIPSKALKTSVNGDYVVVPEAKLTDLTHFTTTAWIKSEGAQQGFAGIVSSGEWCAHCDDTEGLIIDYYGSRLWYKWPGNVGWANNSGMEVPEGEWTFVAMVVHPDSVILYLNEERYVSNTSQQPGSFENLYLGYGHYSKSFNGLIDEVTVWDRALSKTEIRELKHITKEDIIESEPNLKAYYQFSDVFQGTKIMDHAGSYHGVLNNMATLEISTAPIGGGNAQLISLTEGIYEYTFDELDAELFLSDCEESLGDIVITRINIEPDTLPNENLNSENYWIINGYDQANSFGFIDSIKLTPHSMDFSDEINNAVQAKIHLRENPNAHTNSWTTKSSAVNLEGNTFSFPRSVQIGSSKQLFITKGSPYFNEIDPGKYCEPDTVPGKSLKTYNSGDYVQTPDLSFTSDTLTISAWIKPDGIQADYSGVLFNDGTSAGLNFRESNNTLGYHWPGGQWWWDSGLEVPSGEWSHVALVATPTSLTVYLNGVGSTHNTSLDPVDFTTMKIASYKGWSDRNFIGEIDEVALWRRALSQDEIRELIHLTHEDYVSQDSTFHFYIQFNEESTEAIDKSVNAFHSNFTGGAERITSNAPLGGGKSERTDVFSGGEYSFDQTGVTLDFPDNGVYPDGELVSYRINTPPDTYPTEDSILNLSYWIIRNYGSNQSFTALDNITFNGLSPITDLDNDTQLFGLYKRNSNAFGDTWGNVLGSAESILLTGNSMGEISFGSNTSIGSFSQFSIADSRGVKLSVRAFLHAPYDNFQMDDDLRTNYHLPFEEPYSDLGFNHVNGGGNEKSNANVFNQEGTTAIVDWVFIELRNKLDPTEILYTRSALLRRDGMFVDIDGTSAITFNQAIPDDYYIALKHRNHLSIMTSDPYSMDQNITLLDFSNGSVSTWGVNAQFDIGNGLFALWKGNANSDGKISYNGTANDKNAILSQVGLFTPNNVKEGYYSEDVNMDGHIKYNGASNDKNVILFVVGLFTPNNIIIEQMP